MMTTSHMLMAAGATTRPGMRGWLITLGWLGGFVPDSSMFAMVAAARMNLTPTSNLWRRPDGLYWVDPWATLSDLLHSIPIWGAVLLLGLLLWRLAGGKWATAGLACIVFGAGALLHSIADLLTHTNDAHAHFLPFSDWRFSSPVSYYQRAHYGEIFRIFEMTLDAALAIYLVVRFKQWSVRILAVLLAVPALLMQFLARMIF